MKTAPALALPQSPARGSGLPAALRVLALAAAAAAVAAYLYVAVRRVGYPYAVEWLEGGSVEAVRRVVHGQALYPAPSVGYVPYPYTPLYYWVSAAVARLTGVGYLPLRLVSFGASLASLGLLYRLAADEAGAAAGVVAAGLFAAAFRLTGGFYDVARVDSLMLALVLACLLAVARARQGLGFLLAGFLGFLAVMTKQSALVALAPIPVALAFRPGGGRRQAVMFAVSFLVPLVLAGLALDAASSGWFATIAAGVVAGHGIDPTWWLGFWRQDLFPALLPGALLAAVAVAGGRSARHRLYQAAAAGLVLSAYASRLHSASSENVLIPAAAAVALLGGLAFGRVAGGSLRVRGTRLPGLSRPPRRAAAVATLCLGQFALLAYNPASQLPPASQTATARRLATVLRQLPGEVLVVSHPWETTLAGKGDHAHAGAIFDDVRSSDPRARAAVERSLVAAVVAERFSVIAFDNDQDYAGFPPDLATWYHRVAPPPGLGPPPASLQTPFVGHPTQWWVANRWASDPLP